MILLFEILRLDDGEVGFLQVVNTLVENLWHICTAKLSVETVFVNLILAHII